MGDAMVTGRMADEKKARGARVLRSSKLSASQAINLLFDRLIKDGDASFLTGTPATQDASAWEQAARFVDSLSRPQSSRFDSLTKAQIRSERLRDRGLLQ